MHIYSYIYTWLGNLFITGLECDCFIFYNMYKQVYIRNAMNHPTKDEKKSSLMAMVTIQHVRSQL